MIFFGAVPVMMNPAIRTLSPVSTRNRVEILANAPVASGPGTVTVKPPILPAFTAFPIES
jgi:hypothetical protein